MAAVKAFTIWACVLAIFGDAAASPELLPPQFPESPGVRTAAESTESVVTTFGGSSSLPGSTWQPTSTSSSLPFDVAFFFRIGLYSTSPVRTLKIRLRWDNEFTSAGDFHCEQRSPGQATGDVVVGDVAREDWTFDFGEEGLWQSQRILDCSISVWHAEAYWDPEVFVLEAKGPDGEPVDVSGRVCLDCPFSLPRYYAPPSSDYDQCGLNLCGDTDRSGAVASSDALLALQASVQLVQPKYIHAWDVDRNGKVGAPDALRILRRAVGLPERLSCAPPPAALCGYGAPTTTSTSTTSTTEEPPMSGLAAPE